MPNPSLSEGLAAPINGSVDLLIVAGEHSGDEHAARMVRELLGKSPGLKICALGGPRLAVAGAQLLKDMTQGSVMGFAVLKKYFYYRSLIADIVRWIGAHKPRAVCFVDSSGLNLRIAKGLFESGYSAKAGGPTKALYYISPQIWASRAGRRFEMAKHLDGLASIFPFEKAVYADTSLPVEFVGHPFVADDYQAPVSFDPNGPVLLLPGSRRQVVSRLFPVLLEAYRLAETKREAVVLYPSDEILVVLQAANPPSEIRFVPVSEGRVGPCGRTVTGNAARRQATALLNEMACQSASAVLTASGTMSMHCALAGIPGAVTYKTDALTYFLGRLIVKVEHIGIANLLLKEAMYPEFIQGAALPAPLAAQLRECLGSPERLARTRTLAVKLRDQLHAPTQGTAADWMLRQLR